MSPRKPKYTELTAQVAALKFRLAEVEPHLQRFKEAYPELFEQTQRELPLNGEMIEMAMMARLSTVASSTPSLISSVRAMPMGSTKAT